MRPTYANLLRVKGGKLAISLPHAKKPAATGLEVSRLSISVTRSLDRLTVAAGTGDPPGMWINYIATRGTYGLAEAGETWAASGPFSGCQIVLGKRETSPGVSQVFMAHLAQQSGSTSDTDWANRGFRDEVWARWKVPVPSDKFYASSLVFVDWAGGAQPQSISATRVDVRHNRMGALDDTPMEIFNVVQLF